MIFKDLSEYFTDPSERNYFAEIYVDNALIMKIIHWDLRYNAYQHPCDLMVKPFELQPKEQWKMYGMSKEHLSRIHRYRNFFTDIGKWITDTGK